MVRAASSLRSKKVCRWIEEENEVGMGACTISWASAASPAAEGFEYWARKTSNA